MISSRDILQGIDIMAPRTCHTVDDDAEGLIPNLAYIINEAAQRIYIASPITTYQSPRYDQKLAQIARHFPRAEILQARHLFDSTADWRRRWPKILPTLTDLVFFTDHNSTIGLGVWSEVQDAADCIPVWFLDDENRWFSLDNVTVHVIGHSLSRFATVETPGSSRLVPVDHQASPKGCA